MKKRILLMLLAIVMVVSLIPTLALAAPANVKISIEGEGTATASPNPAETGNKVTIYPVPGTGLAVYEITAKSERGFNVPITGPDANGNYTFEMPGWDTNTHSTDVKVIFTQHVTSVSLNKSYLTLSQGDYKTLIPYFTPVSRVNENVTWHSDTPSVATVNNSGKVTAVGPGTATITVTTEDGGYQATCNVTVKKAYTITKTTPANGTFTVKVSGSEVTSAAAGETVTINVTPEEGYAVDTITVTKAGGGTVNVSGTGNSRTFTMPAEAVTVSATFKQIHKHLLCQTANCTLDHNGSNAGAGHSNSDKVEFTAVSTEQQLKDAASTGGSYYLANNIQLTSTIEVKRNLNLCLNGHTISPISPGVNFTGSAFKFSNAATINLTDCGTTGAITGFTSNSAGAGVFILDGANFIMYNGAISNNTTTYGGGGGGLYVRHDGTFTMYGGTISGNAASNGSAGGIAGSITMHGGTITGNTASGKGGGVDGTVTMTGGCIENNTAAKGSSVSGSLMISGSPMISGDVYLGSDGLITITGTLTLPNEYKTIPVYSDNNNQHVKITAGASEHGVITNGEQSIFVAHNAENARIHVHNGEVCQVGRPTVTFDAKGGNPTPDTQTLPLDGDKATEPTEAPTKTACVFSHWCNNEGCTDYTCDGWDFINTVITESMTLYAIWEPFTITVTSEPGKFTAVATPSPEEPANNAYYAYQWYKVIESDTGFIVTPEFLDDGNGFDRYKCDYDNENSKWKINDDEAFNRRFMIYMNSGDTLTMTFDSAPGPMLMYGCNLGTFTSVEQPDESNTCVFTAPSGNNNTPTRDIYVLLFLGNNAPAMKAVYNGSALKPVAGQTATLNTNGLASGQYVCKVTWAAPDSNNYAGVYALSEPVDYTAPAPAPSGDSYTPSYPVVENKTDAPDGTVKLSNNYSAPGNTVTITVTPDKYYSVDKVIVRDANGKEIEVTDNNDGTYSFKMPNSKVGVEAIYVWENPFIDVIEDTFYIDAVEWALKNSITDGTSATTFSPDAACTRAQMVTFLWRAAGCPEPSNNSCSFTDVDMESYYSKAVLWAIENGITNGTSDTAFSPDMKCSRAQMASFMCRMADGKAISDKSTFVDIKDNAYYAEAVQWAVENSITDGTGENMYKPDDTCTRGQMVTFLYRYFVK